EVQLVHRRERSLLRLLPDAAQDFSLACALRPRRFMYPCLHFRSAEWLAQPVALDHVAAELAQTVAGHLVLDAFGHYGEAHVVPELDRRAHNDSVVSVMR